MAKNAAIASATASIFNKTGAKKKLELLVAIFELVLEYKIVKTKKRTA